MALRTRLVLERGLIAGFVSAQVDAQVSRRSTPDADVGLVEGLHLVKQLLVLLVILAETLALAVVRWLLNAECQ